MMAVEEDLDHLYPLLTVISDREGQQESLGVLKKLEDALQRETAQRPSLWDERRGRGQAFHVRVKQDGKALPRRRSVGQAHSPWSPLTPGSSCYPDGIIDAGAWIRKHQEQVPSILLSLHELWEWSMLRQKVTGPLGGNDEVEREHDDELVREIKRTREHVLGDREGSVHFAVILLLKLQHLDSPATKDRIAHVRKTANLDPKLTFVIPEGPDDQLFEYASKLQLTLYESALEHYRNLSRRARRKRSRTRSGTILNGEPRKTSFDSEEGKPRTGLSPLVWSIRAHFKLAIFAEFRQEIDVALQDYEHVYLSLLELTQNTKSCPPKSKLWTGALELADCVVVRMLRLFLYLDQETAAVQIHIKHLKVMTTLLTGVGIGPDSFEYWTWHARQKLHIARVLEAAKERGYFFLTDLPLVESHTGMIPSLLLEQPGDWFLASAESQVRRKETFQAALDESVILSPALEGERKVDHAALIRDLLIKAYGQFRSESRTRKCSLLAREIVKSGPEDKGQYSHALYKVKEDGWPLIAHDLAKFIDVHDGPQGLRYRVECVLLGEDATPMGVMDSDETIDLGHGIDCRALFDSQEASLDEGRFLELWIRTVVPLSCKRIRILLSNAEELVVEHSEDAGTNEFSTPQAMQGNLHIDRVLNLRIALQMKHLTKLEVEKVLLEVEHLTLGVIPREDSKALIGSSTSITVSPPKLQILVTISHPGVAYSGEDYPLELQIWNKSHEEAQVDLDLFLAAESQNVTFATERTPAAATMFRHSERMNPKSVVSQWVRVSSRDPGRRQIETSFCARTISYTGVAEPALGSFVLSVIDAFSVDFDHKVEHDVDGVEGDVKTLVLLDCRIQCEGDQALYLHSVDMLMVDGVELARPMDSPAEPQLMEPGGFYLAKTKLSTHLDRLDGLVLHIAWSRSGDEPSRMEVKCPHLELGQPIPFCTISAPGTLYCHEPIECDLLLSNPTPRVVDAHMSIDPSGQDGFAYAGYRQRSIILLPHGQAILSMILVPLFSGWCRLPMISATNERDGQELIVYRKMKEEKTKAKKPMVESGYDRWIFVM